MKYSVIILFAFFSLQVFSQVSYNDAAKVGLRFISEQADAFPKYSNVHYTVGNSFQLNNNIWVFNLNPEGFILVSNSTMVQPILAYSFNSNCPVDNQSDGFKLWVDNYSRQIALAISTNQSNAQVVNEWERLQSDSYLASKEPGDGMLPMLHTTWDQGVYYNAECPADGAGPAGHVVTGCVATALAQLMNYFRYPLHGEGSYGYAHEDYDWLEVDFSEQTYDYDQMAIELNESNFEVAHLIYNIGVSVDMNYGPDGSGMWNHKGAYTLKTYFGYADETTYLFRDSLPQDFDWAGMLIDHLDQHIPLYYAGWSDYEFISGHAFIFDGYQDSTFFHINWGWGGSSDGYFSVNDLTPGASDFTLLHEAIANAVPNGVYPYSCDGQKQLTAFSGTIDDGSGPLYSYENNRACEWLIVPEDSVMGFEMEFLALELDDNDVITIFDGPDDTSPVIDTYSGNIIPEIFETTSDRVLIRFETNSDSVAGGFLLSYSGIKPTYCTLMSTITAPNGTISDGSNLYDYQNGTFCNWYVQPENAQSITLTFTELNTEPINDYVKILNSSNQTVATLSGNNLPTEPITVEGEKVTVTFRSNPQIRAGGFSLNYTTQFVGVDQEVTNSMILFPNPASEILYIHVPSANAYSNFSIIDATGRVILAQQLSGMQSNIDVSSLKPGHYLLRIPEMGISKALIILK